VRPEYYGDKRDLVKWAILYHLAEKFDCMRILQVAYYRESDWESVYLDGEKKEIPVEILNHFRNPRNIEKINKYETKVFDDVFDDRKKYLESVKTKIIEYDAGKLLLFLDPDIGLETKRPKREQVLKTELQGIWEILKPGSLLVFYQHRFRDKDWKDIRKRELAKCLDIKEIRIRTAEGPKIANDVVFYYIVK
jgi:hypothetical protein